MDFLSIAEKRYSCRRYKHDPIDETVLRRVFEAMRLAPSACNRQPYRLFVLKTEEYRDALLEIYSQSWFVEAPLVVAMVAYLDRSWCHRDGKNLGLVDAAIAFEHVHLAATAEGLATCWVAAFKRAPATTFLNLPDTAEILAFSPLGFPADSPLPKQRLPMDELVQYGVSRRTI
jgi:nitroreductase